jgi:quercetin dioxygenase-like cupin family protein
MGWGLEMHLAGPLLGACLLAACASAAPSAAEETVARIVRAGDPQTVDYAEGEMLRLSPPNRADYAQIRLVEHAGYRTPLHVHPGTDETFLVVEGQLTLFVNGEAQTLQAGDYAFIPRGTPHAQGNTTNEDVVLVLTLSPGAFAGFFDARAELVRTTPPDHPDYRAGMMALGDRFDIDVLGPPPF